MLYYVSCFDAGVQGVRLARSPFPMLTVSKDCLHVSETGHEATWLRTIVRVWQSGKPLNNKPLVLAWSAHVAMMLSKNGIILQENSPHLAVMTVCSVLLCHLCFLRKPALPS